MQKELHIKGSQKILSIIHNFSATEKVIFGLFAIIAILAALIMAWKVNRAFLLTTPAYGSSFSEGIIGLPRSVNPVLAFTDIDKDISSLIYSGLMKYENGKLVPDMAEKYTVSPDGLTYTFILSDDLRFHDGTALTADDVEFTIQKVQDSALKSPRRVDWASVTVKKISEKEIQFILKQPYAPFLSNTTIGIIPKHIWKNVDVDQFIFSQYNIEPIGSGLYKIDAIERDGAGIPRYYVLIPFSHYHGKKAYISKIFFHFYPNEKDAIEAYKAGTIENLGGISPEEASRLDTALEKSVILHTPISRIFGVFFNQNNSPVLANREVRKALNMAVDREKIIREVLKGYGVSVDGPLPTMGSSTNSKKIIADKDEAKSILTKAGWLINQEGIREKKISGGSQTLEFSISTTDAPDLKQAAEIIKSDWEDLGASVTIKVFEFGDLSQNIIKTRKYDALLFGEVIGKDLDIYAFWHSSQRNSPGLNVSMYVNSKVDNLLEEARAESDETKRDDIYKSFQKTIENDIPAVFLYSPEYIYVISDRIKGYDFKYIVNPSDRLHGIDKWHINIDYVWKIFVSDKK
ncbi:MAG TPA: ABC transporter substrate-binding protein [Candidatus Paceibacterota bacterium]